MRTTIVAPVLALLVAALGEAAAQARYPGANWEKTEDLQAAGWSPEGIAAALAYADSIGSEAIFIVQHGAVLVDWGETSRSYKVMSIRKGILSALLGTAVARGDLAIESTLAELEIDDVDPALSDMEKTARVVDLLTARSGIYHPAAYETPGMRRRRPERGSHAPGTFWFYNNWDFNALGTIFQNAAGLSVFEAFDARFARPLRMEDFDVATDTEVALEPGSAHAAYLFRLSARDLARFGLLYLSEGEWEGERILSAAWVSESTSPHVDNGILGGYGYMWWAALGGEHYPFVKLPDGTYSARGTGEQNLVVIPSMDLIIVHMTDVDRPEGRTHVTDFGRLLVRILAARQP